MAKSRKVWMLAPAKKSKSTIPPTVKANLERKAKELIETVLKPQHVQPPPKDRDWNYITDIFTKWHGSYFYFCSTYACPSPNAIAPSFESKFARLEHIGGGRFNLAYMRHTEQWWELHQGLSVDECLELIRDVGTFQP